MKSLILALAGVVCAPCAVWAQSSMAPDAGEAARGSVTGTFAQSFGASALSRGTFSLPSPFDVPSEEGSPLWNIFPTYSPDAGLSEWGMGWQSSLSITRYRPDGELRFTAQGFDRPNADRFTGPWGPMSFSVSQQAWYPDGFRQMVKVVGPITTVGGTSAAARHFCAYMPGGGIAHFRESRENYSWYVDVVQDVHGSKTTIDYDSESGRMLVKSMSYGGVGSYVSDCDALPATAAAETRPYRVELGYAAIDQSAAHIVSLAGARARTQPSSLRHRVSSVLALVRDQPRWHFVLTQHRNPFVPGTWYLESVQKIFASGERLPPMRYTYDTSGGDLLRTEPIDAPLLTNFLRGEDLTAQQFFPPSNPMASGTIPYDRNRDGLMDLIVKADRPSAHAAEHQFFRRDATGFVPNGRAVMPDQFPSPIDGSPTHLTRTLVSASPLRPGGALRFMTYSEEYYVPLTPGTTTPLRPTRRVEFFRSTAGTNPNANATFGPAVGTSIEIDTSITVAGPWVADIDGDHKPDLLFVSRAHGFHLVVRFNTTDANDVPTFSTPRALPEAGGFTSQVWVADLNGDGLADLLWRSSGTGRLHAHLRLGGEPLSADGSLPFTDTAVLVDGDEWPGNARFTFLDANRDGLTDILAVTPLGPRLYLNNGTTAQGQSFVEMFVPAFDSIWLTQNVGDVLVGDLVGDGEEHALFFTQNDGAATVHDIPLTTPSTGLMTAVDDGQGNHYRFRYKRADPQPGLAQRISVLEAVDVTSTGEIDRRYTYAFSGPVSHSLGGFFLGFTQAISTLRATDAPSPSGTPFSREVAEFSHDDVHSSLLTDRTISRPDGLGIVRAERYLYELPTMLFGLPRRRLGLTSVSVGGELIAERTTTSTRVRTYDALGLCPTLVERSEPGASVTTETLYDAAAPARLTEVPGCFARQVTARDDHGSVPMTVGYTRNERGQVLTVTADPLDKPVGVPPIASTPLTTTMSYDAHGMLTSVARPGRGSTTFTYRSDRPMMLARVDRPDGTFSTAGELHPLFGVPLSMTTHTGYTQRFTFDGEERIATQSDNASNTWEQRPLVRLSYQRPNDTRLGAVETHGLIDGPSNAERTAIGLFSASGRRLASALQVVGGYAISGVSEQDPTRGTARAFVQPQILADPKNARLADLTQGAHLLASATVDAIGMPMTSVQTLHDDADGLVQRALSFTQTSSSAGLTATVRENNDPALETESFVSASGALLSYRDQAGQEGVYSYDGFTRLRHVTLPGAAGQPRDEADVQYDAHGRVSVVERWAASANHQPITRFDYSYDATTGLLRMKTVSVAGVVQRRELFNYDPIGRATAHVFGDASGPGGASVDTRTFLFFYDGRTLERDAPVADQKGQLTGISGKGFSKTFTYGIDGRLLGASIDVLGERAVVSSFEYFDDGSPKSETVDVLSPREGATACMSERISKEIGLDVLGRPRQLFVNGELFADIAYDERSRVESVSLTDGSVLAPKYDSFTLASTGFVRYTPDVSTLSQLESSVRYGPRGLVAKEKMESAAGMVERVYGYNQQGFLTSSSDGHGYIYDAASGLSTQIDGANVTRSGSTLTLAAATQVVQT
ncbi:MAG: VCBS repeat-containing protein, partial [Deltaproteobacteria bacterium]|nr:VCBS repeat-containing protein [Deltaproteobacteria bacterium]